MRNVLLWIRMNIVGLLSLAFSVLCASGSVLQGGLDVARDHPLQFFLVGLAGICLGWALCYWFLRIRIPLTLDQWRLKNRLLRDGVIRSPRGRELELLLEMEAKGVVERKVMFNGPHPNEWVLVRKD